MNKHYFAFLLTLLMCLFYFRDLYTGLEILHFIPLILIFLAALHRKNDIFSLSGFYVVILTTLLFVYFQVIPYGMDINIQFTPEMSLALGAKTLGLSISAVLYAISLTRKVSPQG